MLKVQNDRQLEYWPLFATTGVRIGTIVSVQCESDRYRPAWLLVRLPGLRRRLRAVPAEDATWHAPGWLTVPYPPEQVTDSPPATDKSLSDPQWCQTVAAFYQTGAAA